MRPSLPCWSTRRLNSSVLLYTLLTFVLFAHPVFAQEPAAFLEVNGFIAIEAESADLPANWVQLSEESDFRGPGYIKYTGPDRYGGPNENEIIVYRIKITNPGVYRSRLRMSHIGAPAPDLENDAWTKMNDDHWFKTFHPSVREPEGFSFHSFLEDEGPPAEIVEAYYDLSAGYHTFYISGRSRNVRIDRFHFWKIEDPFKIPFDQGVDPDQPESPREGQQSQPGSLSVSPNPIAFGDVIVGENKSISVTLQNPGDEAITVSDVSISGADAGLFGSNFSGSINLGAGESTTLNFTFTPDSEGDKSASASFTHTGTNTPVNRSLTGTGGSGTTGGELAVSPASIDFGDVMVDMNSSSTLSLENTGDESLEINSVTLGGDTPAQFSHNFTSTITLAPGATSSIEVTFEPGSEGAKSATLSLGHTGTNSPVVVALQGNATSSTQPGELSVSPASVDFGSQVVGTTSDPTILTLTNSGETALNVTNVTLGGGDASSFGHNFSGTVALNPGQSTTVETTFSPDSEGSKEATLFVEHNGSNNPFVVSLQGTGEAQGTGPILVIEPRDIVFMPQVTGGSVSMPVILRNAGDEALVISEASLGGTDAAMFDADFTSSITLAAGEEGTLQMTFTPDGVGRKEASLELTHNGSESPQSYGVYGMGLSGNSGDGVLYRINAGGPEIVGADGIPWEEDQVAEESRGNGAASAGTPSPYVNFIENGDWTFGRDEQISQDTTVPAGTPDALFQRGRWDPVNPPSLEWDFPVDAGKEVEVRLYFSEQFFTNVNEPAGEGWPRLFDVAIDDMVYPIFQDFNIFEESGNNIGIMRSVHVISDGTLDLSFINESFTAIVQGIEILGEGGVSTGVEKDQPGSGFSLGSAFPNPSSGNSSLMVSMEESGHVSIEVYDILGRKVGDSERTFVPAGARYEMQIPLTTLPAGTYVYRVKAEMADRLAIQSGRLTLLP